MSRRFLTLNTKLFVFIKPPSINMSGSSLTPFYFFNSLFLASNFFISAIHSWIVLSIMTKVEASIISIFSALRLFSFHCKMCLKKPTKSVSWENTKNQEQQNIKIMKSFINRILSFFSFCLQMMCIFFAIEYR